MVILKSFDFFLRNREAHGQLRYNQSCRQADLQSMLRDLPLLVMVGSFSSNRDLREYFHRLGSSGEGKLPPLHARRLSSHLGLPGHFLS